MSSVMPAENPYSSPQAEVISPIDPLIRKRIIVAIIIIALHSASLVRPIIRYPPITVLVNQNTSNGQQGRYTQVEGDGFRSRQGFLNILRYFEFAILAAWAYRNWQWQIVVLFFACLAAAFIIVLGLIAKHQSGVIQWHYYLDLASYLILAISTAYFSSKEREREQFDRKKRLPNIAEEV